MANKSTSIGLLQNVLIGGDSFLHVKGSFDERIEGDLKSHTEQERQEVSNKGYNMQSFEENIDI